MCRCALISGGSCGSAINMLSKTIEIRFVRDELLHSDQDQTRSVLDRIRHNQVPEPIELGRLAGQGRAG